MWSYANPIRGVSLLFGSYFHKCNFMHASELYMFWLDLQFTQLKGELTVCGSKMTRCVNQNRGILFKTQPNCVHKRYTCVHAVLLYCLYITTHN